MELPVGLRHIIGQTRLYTDDREYVVIRVPLDDVYEGTAMLAKMAEPFSTAIVDKDEMTLVLPEDIWEEVRDDFEWNQELLGYRLITFDIALELGLVGYLATLTHVVSEAGVSMLAFSAYQRDHLLVPASDFDQAWSALSDFIIACREAEEEV
ncbi:MAG: ACT domain-containing protein [Anaerolineae bacterium]|jgi:hypothetical protein